MEGKIETDGFPKDATFLLAIGSFRLASGLLPLLTIMT